MIKFEDPSQLYGVEKLKVFTPVVGVYDADENTGLNVAVELIPADMFTSAVLATETA